MISSIILVSKQEKAVMEEKNYLQSIKLEISKNVKLEPYERIAYHKLLGIHQTDASMTILSNELAKHQVLRRSAVSSLSSYDKSEALAYLIPYLGRNITQGEMMQILDMAVHCGGKDAIPPVMEFIESRKKDDASLQLVGKAFEVLSTAGAGTAEALDFVLSAIKSDDTGPAFKSYAILALSAFKSIATYEELLKKDDAAMTNAVYKSLYTLICNTVDAMGQGDSEEERLYTYSPDREDKIILDIRVLLGKMAARFDDYASLTKVAFISSMIACGHREFLIYAMKALTSKDQELATMTLYCIYKNIGRIRDPDKLLRNLISLSTENDRDGELIVQIFVKFFSAPKNTRQFHLLQDKMYSYIIVTLETYFESYRKEFMITDVIEKGLPESFQNIRRFMLERLSPELKKKIVGFLLHDDASMINHIITDLAKWLTHVDDEDKEILAVFLDMLYDKDKKTRENSGSRLDDLNYDKRYLRDRIKRLCAVIEKLNITDAASVLVNIYNYLKKYPDQKIMNSVQHTLAVLNYSYMLGEIEVMIATGSETDRLRAIHLLSLFTETRSLNLIFEVIQARKEEESDIVREALAILLERDIRGNGTASQLLKAVIEKNNDKTIRNLAILALGKTCFESDVDFLNGLFYTMERTEPKDTIVRALSEVAVHGVVSNRRQLIKHFQEYLRDPNIKVRIYSCFLLAHLGYKEASRYIRDMLVIKNKDIQRDMIGLLEQLKSLEFAFFLISLVTPEYAITDDVVHVLKSLSPEDKKEINAFVVNMFQKYERPDIESVGQQPEKREVQIAGLNDDIGTVLQADIHPGEGYDTESIADVITLTIWTRSHLVSVIHDHGGIITFMSKLEIIALFSDPKSAMEGAMKIASIIDSYNQWKTVKRNINIFLQVFTGPIRSIKDEILEKPDQDLVKSTDHPFINKIVVNAKAMELLKQNYTLMKIPGLAITGSTFAVEHYELISLINFLDVSESIIKSLAMEEEKKQELQQKIEAEIKKLKMQSRSTSSVAIARELDVIGNRLQDLLDDIDRYVQKRSTDRELIKTVHKMLANVYNLYKVELSKIIIE